VIWTGAVVGYGLEERHLALEDCVLDAAWRIESVYVREV